jgi:hypothetical protein
VPAYRIPRMPWKRLQVLVVDLNRSEPAGTRLVHFWKGSDISFDGRRDPAL